MDKKERRYEPVNYEESVEVEVLGCKVEVLKYVPLKTKYQVLDEMCDLLIDIDSNGYAHKTTAADMLIWSALIDLYTDIDSASMSGDELFELCDALFCNYSQYRLTEASPDMMTMRIMIEERVAERIDDLNQARNVGFVLGNLAKDLMNEDAAAKDFAKSAEINNFLVKLMRDAQREPKSDEGMMPKGINLSKRKK